MKITRRETIDMFKEKWCPTCGETVDMNHISTGMPGISAQQCPLCENYYEVNYLESPDDLLEIPNTFILRRN